MDLRTFASGVLFVSLDLQIWIYEQRENGFSHGPGFVELDHWTCALGVVLMDMNLWTGTCELGQLDLYVLLKLCL